MNFRMTLVAVTGIIILSACADGNYRPYRVDDNFGRTERQLVKAQIADPQAAENPPADSPRKMDGYAGVNTIGGYRDGFSLQTSQPQGLTINIGSGSESSGGN
jgi:hypothetical protein